MTKTAANSGSTYIMEVASKDALLEWSHKYLQKLQIKRIESHLAHMYVTRGHCLVAALETIVVVAAVGPFAIRLHDGHQIIAECIGHNLEPEDIRTRLWYDHALVQLGRIIWMDILQGPVILIAEQRIEIGTHNCGIEVIRIDQMSMVALIADVHEDALNERINY